jgi:hypothetical protein
MITAIYARKSNDQSAIADEQKSIARQVDHARGVISGSHSSARGHVYGCLAYLKRGTSVCGNSLRLPLDRVDDAVLRTLADDVLRPPAVIAVIDGVLEQLRSRSGKRELERSRAALQTVERAISNLAQAIAAAGDLGPLLHELQAARIKRDELWTRSTPSSARTFDGSTEPRLRPRFRST